MEITINYIAIDIKVLPGETILESNLVFYFSPL